MIRIHHFPKDAPDSTDAYTDASHWGTIQDGNVIAVNEDAGPDNRTFEDFVEGLHEKLLDGVIDPIAVTQELQYGGTRAVVPSEQNPETLYTGNDARKIIVDGDLGTVETYEVEKYIARESEGVDGPVYKKYQFSKPYQELVIHSRSNGDMTEIARIDIEKRDVISISEEDTFQSMLRFLKSEAPTMNPVKVLQLNTRTRVSGVIDPDTNELVLSPEEVKRDPDVIRDTVLSDS